MYNDRTKQSFWYRILLKAFLLSIVVLISLEKKNVAERCMDIIFDLPMAVCSTIFLCSNTDNKVYLGRLVSGS